MFIFEILIYVFFAWIMFYLAKNSYYVNHTNRWDIYLIIFILFYTVICAIRWNVGVDSVTYAYNFTYGDTRTYDQINGEILFSWLQNTSAKLNLHYSFGLGLCAFLQIFFLTKALKRYRYILMTLPIVLFGGKYFLSLNNGVCQMIVASMFVYASKYIVERKIWFYLLFVIIASTIHHSALMLLPFYLIPNSFKIADKRILMLIVFIICFIAGLTPAFQGIVLYVEKFAYAFGYDNYVDNISTLLLQGQTDEALAFGPIMLSYFLLAICCIIFGPQLRARYEKLIPYFNLWYNFSFIYGCAYFLICNISHLFIRPVQYLELFQLVIVSLLLFDLGFSRFQKKSLGIFLTIIIWVAIAWNVTKAYNSGNDMESSSYKVFFLHQDQIDKSFQYRHN